MTIITKTGQQAVSNVKLIQKTQFEVAQTVADTRPVMQAAQPVQVKQIRTPALSQNVIIKTNGQLRSFKVTPKGGQLVISTPKGVPVGTLPNTPASINALKLSGVTALGTGQVATGSTAVASTTAAGTAGGFLTLGTLITIGLSLLAGGVAFFAGMGSANSEEPDVRKMEADRAARLKKEKDQKADRPQFKAKFKPLRPLKGTKFVPSFMPPIAPAPFKPAAKPALPLKSPPMPYKPVPTVPALPQIPPAPKGGSVKSPFVKGLKLAPLTANYVGARRDVKADKPADKKAKGQVRASKSENITSEKNEGQTRAEKLKSTPLEERHGNKWMKYYAVYYEWCKQHSIEPSENSDPLNPDNSQPVGFHSINGVTKYKSASGEYHDASIFDAYLNNTLPARLIETNINQIENDPETQSVAHIQSSKNNTTQQLPKPNAVPQNMRGINPTAEEATNPKPVKPKLPKAPKKVAKAKIEKPEVAKPPKPPKNETRQKSALQFAKYNQGIKNAKDDHEKITVTNTYIDEINEQIKTIYAEISTYRTQNDAIRLELAKQAGSNITASHHNFAQTQQAIESDKAKQSIEPQVSQTLEEANKALQNAKNRKSNATIYRSVQETNLKKLEALKASMPASVPEQLTERQLAEREKSREWAKKSRAKKRLAEQQQLPPQN